MGRRSISPNNPESYQKPIDFDKDLTRDDVECEEEYFPLSPRYHDNQNRYKCLNYFWVGVIGIVLFKLFFGEN